MEQGNEIGVRQPFASVLKKNKRGLREAVAQLQSEDLMWRV
jgi:hypothetical protein